MGCIKLVGLVNVHGVPKPAYRAFQLLHELGEELATVTMSGGGNSTTPTDCASSVGVLASLSNSTTLSVLLFSQVRLARAIISNTPKYITHICPFCCTHVL